MNKLLMARHETSPSDVIEYTNGNNQKKNVWSNEAFRKETSRNLQQPERMDFIFSTLGLQRTHSYHEQLQKYDTEIRYFHTRQRKYNVRVNSFPSKITQMILFLCICVCIPIFVYIPPPNSYYIIAAVMALFLCV